MDTETIKVACYTAAGWGDFLAGVFTACGLLVTVALAGAMFWRTR